MLKSQKIHLLKMWMKVGTDMIGSLLYLITSHPDIANVVGVCAHYLSAPQMSHLHSIKRILKYVLGTS